MEGILLIDKPIGWTSFDVVNKVRHTIAAAENVRPKTLKVGHTGTLDPLATGLLVILVGKTYTRQADMLSKQDKTYIVTATLGQTSTTGDDEGVKTLISEQRPARVDIEHACKRFTGDIMQKPPIYSAIKVDGKRAYDLARSGKAIDLAARQVTVHAIQLIRYEYPNLEFSCAVSSGTYIRSLVEDIGDFLSVGAYVSALRRTSIGCFNLDAAIDGSELTAEKIAQNIQPKK